ncbi:MAG: WecB/TagA/CpsF family glycosyltransferase [Victivallaceae bacterium]
MKILILCVPYDGGKSGVSVYIDNVVRELAAAGHELTLVVEAEAAPFFRGYRLITLPKICNRAVFSMFYCLWVLPFHIRGGGFDRIIVTAANRRFTAWGRGMMVLAVIHDLSQFHVAGKYDFLRMFYVKRLLPHCLRRNAAHVFAVSSSTAADVVRFTGIPRCKVSVNYNGYNPAGLPLGANDGAAKIVLYVSRIEAPGKNHANLIRAWEKLPRELTSSYKLVIAGADWSGAEEIHRMAEASPCCDSIEFTGFITKEKLYELYAHASLYVFPSFFEGFGLSLIEAMASGLVACCSNNSSLGEIAGDAAATFDPGNVDEMARVIGRCLTDEPLRRELRARGLRRAEDFSWKKHAEILAGPLNDEAEVFGVTFSTRTMAQALEWIDASIREKSKRFAAFINADCLNQAYVNSDYRAVLAKADMVWPDGVGVEIAARYFNTPVRENVNGTDMLPLLCEKKYRIYLLGAAPGVAETARRNLEAQHPGLVIAGVHDGFWRPDQETELIRSINQARPEILLVALGCPKQEKWITANLPELECNVAIGVGGLFDFASGRIPRAPRWMRKFKIEWTYRLYNEPRRLFRRYVIGNPLFLYRVVFGRKWKN